MVNGKNMAVIEAKQSRKCQWLSPGACHDATIMLYGMPGAFFLLMRGIHRFISTIMLNKQV